MAHTSDRWGAGGGRSAAGTTWYFSVPPLPVAVPRRAANRAALPSDLSGWWCVAVFQLCLLLLKTLLRERQPWLAAVNSTHALLALALAALIRRRPKLYAAAREPLVFLASLHFSFVTVNGGEILSRTHA